MIALSAKNVGAGGFCPWQRLEWAASIFTEFNTGKGITMFIAPAFAAGAAPGPDSLILQFAPMLVIGVLFWFLLIRPQQKRAKEHAALLATLKKGDEVTTTSGMVARVVSVSDAYFVLEVSEGVHVTVQRGAVSGKLEEGTLKKIGK